MTTIDTAHLRALAEAALDDDPNTPRRAVDAFISDAEEAFDNAIDPPTLIALLDRLEELEGREPEWEYGVDIGYKRPQIKVHGGVPPASTWPTTFRRRKAGPWQPVTGDDDA